MKYQVSIFHNIMWSTYKGVIFSELQKKINSDDNIEICFYQIAETEINRKSLSSVDLKYHKYNYELLFKDSYEDINKFYLYLKLAKICLLTKSDLIILPGYHLIEHWLMLIILKIRGKKIGVFCDSTLNDRPRKRWKTILKKIFFNKCRVFFAYGIRSKEFLESYNVDSKKIYKDCQSVVPNNFFSLDEIINSKKNIAKSFLFVGRLSNEKRIDFLLESFAEVLKIYPYVLLNIVGEGSEKQNLINLVNSLGINENVIFKGAMTTEQLQYEYLSATCLILPSKSEAWGLVVNEAMQLGCPAITSNLCGCVPELVHDNVTGYSFKWNSKDSLIEKMCLLLNLKNQSLVEMNINCIKTISKFSPKNAAQQIYTGIVNELSK